MKNDIGWKQFFADKQRYADFINGIAGKGTAIVKSTDLKDVTTQSQTGRARDLLCQCAFGINFVLMGIENQETIDYAMPSRILEYDATEYRKQLSAIQRENRNTKTGLQSGEYLYGFCKSDKLKPIITFVLYSGEKVWDGATSLRDMLDFADVPDALQVLTVDCKINLVEIRRIENTDIFKTDVRQVFEFIKCAEDKLKLRNLVENDEYYQHMEEDAYDVVALYTHSKELIRAKEYLRTEGKIDMCTAIKEMMNDSKQEGIAEGIKEGIKEGIAEGIKEGIKEGESLLAALMIKLFADNRADDAKLAAENEETREKFYREYGLRNT